MAWKNATHPDAQSDLSILGLHGGPGKHADNPWVVQLDKDLIDLESDDSVSLQSQDPYVSKLEADNKLLRRLLDLGQRENLEPFLSEALALIVDATCARCGYLELYKGDESADPDWWIAHGFDATDITRIRRQISSGIIAETLAKGVTVSTSSALEDPRFADRPSVRRERIDAVLCVPIGDDASRGAFYLQGRNEPGPFSNDDVERAEIFGRHIGLLAYRLTRERERRESADPTTELRKKLHLEGVIGRSEAFALVLKQIVFVAPLNVGVLLTGDSGTGKTQLARVIHNSSPRASRPFLELNCAALPDSLIESELFGALPGAHSTASKAVEGKIAAADRGTLLLDEIGELSLNSQAKLLQFLQSRQYFPLGATKPSRADVRIIAATNVDLKQAVEERRFREDLFFRVQVVPIRVPSLAERRDDIPELVDALCKEACERHGLPRLEPSRNAIRAAWCADWPGNVRELANAVEKAVIFAAGEQSEKVERQHLFPDLGAATEEPITFQQATRRFHAQLIRDTLEDSGGNVLQASRRLDLSKSRLYELIRSLGLDRERKDPR